MNPDPVPPVRPLLTHVIADEPLRREAGINKARAFQDEQGQMYRRNKVRAGNQKRAQRYCDLKCEKKIEAGWVPGQK